MLKHVSINVPLVEALEQMSGYAKFMKDLVTKKISITFEDDDRMQHCSAISTRSLVQKKEDLGAFTIPCTIGLLHFMKDLVTKKKSVTFENDDRMQHCSAIATRSLVQKKEDPGAFTIPCIVRLRKHYVI